MSPWRAFAVVVVAVALTAACRPALPLAFRTTATHIHSASGVDLDRDGVDELAIRYRLQRDIPGEHSVLMLRTQSGRIIDQLNFAGVALAPSFADTDGDSRLEILTPVLRRDSLFVVLADDAGRKTSAFFLANGTPRRELEGPLPWDPAVVFHVLDTDGDGTNELVTVLNTGYARAPRGVLVHALPGGAPRSRLTVGAAIYQSIPVPASDGAPALLVSTIATNNGATAGGLDDRHTYLLSIGLTPAVIRRSRKMDTGRATAASYRDHDGDGRPEILVFIAGHRGDTRATRIELLDPVTWNVVRSRDVGETLFAPVLTDVDRDGRLELVAAGPTGVRMFDAGLGDLRRGPFITAVSNLEAWPDLDGDGVDEIAAYLPEGGFLLLAPDLAIKARRPSGYITGVLRRGNDVPPALLVVDQGSQVVDVLERNRSAWWYRVRVGVVIVAGILLLGGVGGAFYVQRRRLRALQALVQAPAPGDPTRAWGLMAQRVAHGLKNPLTSILLTLQRLQIEYRERAPAVANRLDRYSRRIEDRIEQLRQMTNNFLKFVDVERPVLRRLNLNDLVRGFAESLSRTLPPDIRVVTRLAPDLPDVQADADQIRAALDNLTANAVNAMLEGGVITIVTAPAACARPGEAPVDGAALEVLDTGVGIAEAVRPRLFEAGVSGTDGGSGLGLAIVRKIVTDHGGTITVSSEAGIGSAFTLVVPTS